jgi:hypothetical protein
MCHGDTAILLFDGGGRQFAAIGVHHGHAIRWDQWKDDAQLVDGWQLVNWLNDHGVPYRLSDQETRERSLNRIPVYLGRSLERVGRALYATTDRETCLSLGVSGRQHEATFHFAFRSDQHSVLQTAVRGYAAFACGSPYRILLVPFSELASWLAALQPITVSGGDSYWPIHVTERPEGFLLQGLSVQHDLRRFLLPKHP